MLYFNGLIGCMFVVMIALQIGGSGSLQEIGLFSVGGLLAALTFKAEMSTGLARVLAIATTVMMFVYFATFFRLAPELQAHWYQAPPRVALSNLFAAFGMIPVLSAYSCRLKAECREAYQQRRRAFFSAPAHLTDSSPPRHS